MQCSAAGKAAADLLGQRLAFQSQFSGCLPMQCACCCCAALHASRATVITLHCIWSTLWHREEFKCVSQS